MDDGQKQKSTSRLSIKGDCQQCGESIELAIAKGTKGLFCPYCGKPLFSEDKGATKDNVENRKQIDPKAAQPAGFHLALAARALGLLILVLGVAFIVTRDAHKSVPQPDQSGEKYPGPWRDDAPGVLIKALVQAKVRGCGSFRYRRRGDDPEEYLVYCTADGHNYTGYIIWHPGPFGSVVGPFKPDSSLAPLP